MLNVNATVLIHEYRNKIQKSNKRKNFETSDDPGDSEQTPGKF